MNQDKSTTHSQKSHHAKMEYFKCSVKLMLILLVLIQVIDGSTCPTNCHCSLEEKAVICFAQNHDGGPNVTQFEAILDSISNQTAKLYIMGMKIPHLGNKIFSRLSALRELSIKDSHVTTLSEDTFSGLRNLEVLTLSWNKLQTLPRGLFKHLVKLKTINLEKNLFTNFENASFDGLQNLERLILRKNRLVNIHEGIFTGLNKLKELDLSENKALRIHPGTFRHSLNLKTLGLHQIGFTGDILTGILQELKLLCRLDISGNKLTKIPKIGTPESLQVLIMSNNDLKFIPSDTFRNFANLKEIRLDFCNISSIHDRAFSGLSRLQTLRLDHNHLTSLSLSAITPKMLTSVSLSLIGNLWSCDCRMYNMKEWILQSGRNVNIVCDRPDKYYGLKLHLLPAGVPSCQKPVINDCCHESFLVKYGDNVTLNCSATGIPKPKTNFSTTISAIGEAVQHGLHTVTISSIHADGNFSCEATNVIGVARKYFMIKVIPTDCGPDIRVIILFATLIAVAVLILLTILYLTKFKHRKCRSRRSDKNYYLDILKLVDNTSVGSEAGC